MSFCDRISRLLPLAVLAALVGLSACTVTPLYGNVTTGATAPGQAGAPARVASISIEPPVSREEQEVYNHMIFLLHGGAGEPDKARYRLRLGVVSRQVATAVRQIVTDGPNERQPTSGSVVMSSRYVLTDTETGEVVSQGNREISASYDVPKQEFAAMRAVRDAEDRAARELAELVRIALLQDMKKTGL
ncbi:MAG: hypothetical protein K5872_14085 [Rhizobiaceae bacterium]|nr:hypothetical protein [Rhizobiaceae bacterium]MCV0407349.1 hypothetical protein [Rhizobiaceae bacterium]